MKACIPPLTFILSPTGGEETNWKLFSATGGEETNWKLLSRTGGEEYHLGSPLPIGERVRVRGNFQPLTSGGPGAALQSDALLPGFSPYRGSASLLHISLLDLFVTNTYS